MKNKEIEEGNKLIAEFMGGYYDDFEKWWVLPHCNDMHLQYDQSWDWLMPVVEKIESLGYEFWIGKYASAITQNRNLTFSINYESEVKIDSVYNCCIEFIKWHKQNTKEG